MCRPRKCSHDGCHKATHFIYWSVRLCRKHGRTAGGASRKPYQTLAQALTKRAAGGSRKREQRYQKCSIEWCDQRARVCVEKHRDPQPACKLHASWLAAPVEGTNKGIRKGRLAARCALADAVFGDMPSADLSLDGPFEHRCQHCSALYFSAESVPCPITNGRVFLAVVSTVASSTFLCSRPLRRS